MKWFQTRLELHSWLNIWPDLLTRLSLYRFQQQHRHFTLKVNRSWRKSVHEDLSQPAAPLEHFDIWRKQRGGGKT